MSNQRLSKKFLFCFGLIVIPLMVILSFFFAQSNRLQQENERFLNENLALQTVSSVQQQIGLAENMCKALLQNEMLITFLDKEFHTQPDLTYYLTTVHNFVKVTNGVSDIKLKLFLENDTIPIGFGIFYPIHYLDSAPEIQSFYTDPEKNAIWLNGSYDYQGDKKFKPNPDDTFCYFLKIKSGTKDLGIIMASIPQKIFAVERPDGSGTMAPVYLKNCCIYNHTSQELSDEAVQSLLENGSYGDFLGTFYDFPDGPFRVLVVTRHTRNVLIVPTFILICIACALLTGIYILLTRHLLRDIYHCLDGIEMAAQNNFKTGAGEKYIHDVLSARNDEIATLAQRILFLMNRIRDLLEQYAKEQTAAKQAQLLALQHQINPHFMYNTMEVFSSRMELAGLYEESAAISAFCRMLRYNINTEGLTTLADELNQVENYLAIQKIRNIPFDISIIVPDSLMPEPVIRFLLEPFIENSFKYHGNANPLHIIITAKDCGDNFQIIICNNGEVLSQERIDELNQRFLLAPAVISSSGDKIGLNNINSRLKLFYGETHTIHADNVNGWIQFSFLVKKQ